jgi:hypothetical protein
VKGLAALAAQSGVDFCGLPQTFARQTGFCFRYPDDPFDLSPIGDAQHSFTVSLKRQDMTPALPELHPHGRKRSQHPDAPLHNKQSTESPMLCPLLGTALIL